MVVSEMTATKHIIARQRSLHKFCTELYDNPTNNLVADT